MMLRGDGAVTVAVLGASGYTGGELVRLLASHPRAEVTLLGARDAAGKTLAESHPHLAGADGLASMILEPIEPEIVADRARVVFSALPSGASSTLAPDLVQRGVRVIDLAGDFRLPAAAYPEWYGFHHPAPEWLDKAVYGLPELFADQILGAPLIANPGCFATAALLSLAPLLGAGLVSRTMIHVDGKTGLSGAGRVATDSTTFNA